MAKKYIPNVVRGGAAIPLKNRANYFYMTGRKHENGGIDVGSNPRTGLEVEDGEVMHITKDEARVFSSVPFLNGKSPAEKVMNGENPNKVFRQQEDYKDKNSLNDDGTKRKKARNGIWEKLDSYADTAEKGLALTNIGLTGATIAAPNPYTLGAAYISSLASGALDVYQGIRSGIKGDWPIAAKNATELGLSLIGAKALSNASKYSKLDKALDVSGATRNYITKTVGRGRGRTKAKFTTEKNKEINNYGIGFGSNIGSDASSLMDTNKKYKAGGVYSVTSNGKTSLRMIPSTGEWSKDDNKLKLGADIKKFVKDNPDIVSDSIDLGSNLIGSIISHSSNKRMLSNLKYSGAPVARKPVKLKTRININPQLDKMRETAAAYERDIDSNTASSRVALARKQRGRLANMLQTNELYANKENIETELINKDRLNQQTVADRNITEYNAWQERKAAFDNAVREKQAENDISLIQNINAGIQDTITRSEKRKSDKQNRIAISAANPNVNPRLLRDLGIKGISDEEIANWERVNKKGVKQ